jgi:hypothetical protein
LGESPQANRVRFPGAIYGSKNPRGHSLGADWNSGEFPQANRARGNLPKSTVSVSPELYTVSKPPGALPGGSLELGGVSPSQPCPGGSPRNYIRLQNPRGHSLGAGWNLGESPQANRVRGNLPGTIYGLIPPRGRLPGGPQELGGVPPSQPCPYPRNYIRFQDPKGQSPGAAWNLGEPPQVNRVRLPGTIYGLKPPGALPGGSLELGGVSPSQPCPGETPRSYIRLQNPPGVSHGGTQELGGVSPSQPCPGEYPRDYLRFQNPRLPGVAWNLGESP